MKKLFPTEASLQIVPFEQIRFNGKYELESISDEYYECTIQQYRIQLSAKNIEVQYLHDQGFLVSCRALHKLVIERNSE